MEAIEASCRIMAGWCLSSVERKCSECHCQMDKRLSIRNADHEQRIGDAVGSDLFSRTERRIMFFIGHRYSNLASAKKAYNSM